MTTPQKVDVSQSTDVEWVSFPGHELEGARPKVLCPDCRAAERDRTDRSGSGECESQGGASRTLCFRCYRTGLLLERVRRAIRGDRTGERWQWQLPFEPVNKGRLIALRGDRAQARTASRLGAGRLVDKRRRAQLEARHALQQIAERLTHSDAAAPRSPLPDAWLPFVVSR